MSLPAVQDALRDLLQKDVIRVEKFLEHLELAKVLSDDHRVTTFIEHTIEEETEHLNKARALLAQVEALDVSSVEPLAADAPAPAVVGLPDTHQRLRDDNVLTVGSLFGTGR
jgi:Asp-tRNA(Asn)/Glu-tRNA(Gln) amidotransferase C subunit